jgi:hypothetical protein
MIAFASLFLGLIVGTRPVTVVVGAPVASVVFQLDGKEVGNLSKAPWTLGVDFGSEFSPHELVARAFDDQGGEIGMTRQWVNLPRPPAEVEVVVERDAQGRAVAAHLTWQSVLGAKPTKVAVTFDGKPLVLDASQRVALPAYDPAALHVLTAALEYPNDVRTRSDRVIGGGSASETKTELTAVPVVTKKAKAPKVETLRGRFRKKDGERLEVAAVEHGPAEVLVVRDLDSKEAQRVLRRIAGSKSSTAGFTGTTRDPGYGAERMALDPDDRLRILWPVASQVVDSGISNELFEGSHAFAGWMSDFRFLLTRVDYPGNTDRPRRYADAVALAGLRAFGGYSRRAVVLVLGSDPADESLYKPAPVRRYLERLRVPLFVWSFSPTEKRPRAFADWGEIADISTVSGLEHAVDKLHDELEHQSIVWLEGRHLPQDIELTGGADGTRLVAPELSSRAIARDPELGRP